MPSRPRFRCPPDLDPLLVIAGVDEAGRGSLAGPVYAAAVVLGARVPRGLNDSKKLSAPQREALDLKIRGCAVAWCVGRAEVEEIEAINILHASLLAMRRAVEGLSVAAQHCLVDGNRPPPLSVPVTTIVEGDALVPAIMAASIIAKVARDAEMRRLCAVYPHYGFSQHKGYGTPEHLLALREHGPCAVHRMKFAPCADVRRAVPAEFGAELLAATGRP